MTLPIPPKSFYFIRHGQSEWNALNKFAGGQTDTPLTKLGQEQAKSAVSTFENLIPQPTHIIHSPLSRAKDTAKTLNKNINLPMIEITDLREIDAGDWAGINNETAKQKWNKGEKPNNGENLDDFANRIKTVFSEILSNNKYDIPFISAHGRIINAIDHIYGVKPRSLQIDNCQILKFIPSTNKNRQYPWNVYTCHVKNNKVIETIANWSQI